ncbi:hypothetical protein EJ06DRAFT_518590 [Trichodelitschia bisporula]|uniref:Uncharacterized protein n=1 Tax=Trichodelitschia bisporula TaxID=703511 RepID=A0A6G1I7C5_9PEZI|nr:hypothetical protein EJ06DRAFT_518590 [Trichodelitschia bisporula]
MCRAYIKSYACGHTDWNSHYMFFCTRLYNEIIRINDPGECNSSHQDKNTAPWSEPSSELTNRTPTPPYLPFRPAPRCQPDAPRELWHDEGVCPRCEERTRMQMLWWERGNEEWAVRWRPGCHQAECGCACGRRPVQARWLLPSENKLFLRAGVPLSIGMPKTFFRYPESEFKADGVNLPSKNPPMSIRQGRHLHLFNATTLPEADLGIDLVLEVESSSVPLLHIACNRFFARTTYQDFVTKLGRKYGLAIYPCSHKQLNGPDLNGPVCHPLECDAVIEKCVGMAADAQKRVWKKEKGAWRHGCDPTEHVLALLQMCVEDRHEEGLSMRLPVKTAETVKRVAAERRVLIFRSHTSSEAHHLNQAVTEACG